MEKQITTVYVPTEQGKRFTEMLYRDGGLIEWSNVYLYSHAEHLAAQAALSKAEDKCNNGWISVEDRLPEYGKYILVIGTDAMQYGIERFHVCEMNDLEDGIEFKETRQFYWLTESGRKIDKVTHWQPLPPKP